LREVVRYGKKLGMTIMLENCPKGITEFEDFKYIVNNVSGLKVHFDIAHAFVCGGMKDIKKYIKNFGSKIEHVHLSDNHGKEDEHLPIGKGDISFKRVVKMLKNINYNKTITFEVFTEDKKDVVRSREKIKKLWEMIE
jgi:sugar phosphate isomerase/epimerase